MGEVEVSTIGTDGGDLSGATVSTSETRGMSYCNKIIPLNLSPPKIFDLTREILKFKKDDYFELTQKFFRPKY